MNDNNIEIKMAKMEKDIEYIKKEMKTLGSKFDDFLVCADNKYAPIWIKNFVWFLFTVVVAAVISIFIK